MAAVEEHVMKRISIGKVVLNIGVGKSGEALERAKKVLEGLAGQKANVRRARKTIRDFGIHRGEPIGVMVTLRGDRAEAVLKRLLAAKGNKLPERCFDEYGSCSFGIKEHIEIPGVKYDPEIGIFGMDVCVLLERLGYRVMRRRRARSDVGRRHRVSKEDAVAFFKEMLGLEVY